VKVEDAIDTCIQCGFCLQACPTYRLFGREESSPRGRIARLKDVLAGQVEATPETLATFSECLGCRACEAACPSGVAYETVLLVGRERLRSLQPPGPLAERSLLRVVRSTVLLAAAKALWRRAGRRIVALAGGYGRASSAVRLLAALPPPQDVPDVAPRAGAAVQVHRGCLMDAVWPQTNARAVLMLRDAGVAADLLPASAGCCGALHAHQGDLPAARAMAMRVIEAFEASGGELLVSLAGGCAAHLRTYGELLAEEPLWAERGGRLAAAVRDAATLLAERGVRVEAGTEATRTYQDSCHLRNGLGVQSEPRSLLGGPGYREMPSAGECCGSAGIYNLLRPDVSDRILAAKVREVRELGAATVVTANPGCELQWRLGALEDGGAFEVRHLVDWIWEQRAPRDGAPCEGAARVQSVE